MTIKEELRIHGQYVRELEWFLTNMKNSNSKHTDYAVGYDDAIKAVQAYHYSITNSLASLAQAIERGDNA